MPSYLRFAGATLPRGVGKDMPGGTRISEGVAGHLCFGPYSTLDSGKYVAGYYMRLLPGSAVSTIDFDVAVAGQDSLVHKTVSTRELFEDTLSLVSLEFELDERAESTEVRLYVQKGVLIEVDELVIFSRRPRNWSGK